MVPLWSFTDVKSTDAGKGAPKQRHRLRLAGQSRRESRWIGSAIRNPSRRKGGGEEEKNLSKYQTSLVALDNHLTWLKVYGAKEAPTQ